MNRLKDSIHVYWRQSLSSMWLLDPSYLGAANHAPCRLPPLLFGLFSPYAWILAGVFVGLQNKCSFHQFITRCFYARLQKIGPCMSSFWIHQPDYNLTTIEKTLEQLPRMFEQARFPLLPTGEPRHICYFLNQWPCRFANSANGRSTLLRDTKSLTEGAGPSAEKGPQPELSSCVNSPLN